MRRAALVLVGCIACAPTKPAVIPRFGETPPAAQSRMVDGMNYTPTDIPLRWLGNGDLVIAHGETYSSGDVGSATCSGSGFYSVRTSGASTARALLVGAPACEGALAENIAVDPTGRVVIYSTWVPTNRIQLVELDLVTGRLDTLSSGCAVYDDEPAISRDGKRIASSGMCRSRESEYELYVSGMDGSGLARIGGSDSASHVSPSWSPDGSHLAFVRRSGPSEESKERISVIDVDGQSMREIATGRAPAWSPDGEWIAFLGPDTSRGRYEEDIRLVRAAGGDERVILANAIRSTFSRGWGEMFEGQIRGPLVWSPDGGKLAYMRDFDDGSFVWILDVGTGETHQLTTKSPP